jgi:hypothetical protein
MKLKLDDNATARRLQISELQSTDWNLLRAGVQKLLRENTRVLVLDFGTLAAAPERFQERHAELRASALLQDTPIFTVILCPGVAPGAGIFMTWETLREALRTGEPQRKFAEESAEAQLRALRAELDAPETRAAQTLDLRAQAARLKRTHRFLRARVANFAQRMRARSDLELQPRLAPSAVLHQALETICKKEGLL